MESSTSAGFVGFLSFVSDVLFNFLESQGLESWDTQGFKRRVGPTDKCLRISAKEDLSNLTK